MARRQCPSCKSLSDDDYCQTCLVATVPEEDASGKQGQDGEDEQGQQGQMPQGKDAEASWGGGSPQASEARFPNVQQGRCPHCGMPGSPGGECPQCGAMLPMPCCANETIRSEPLSACLVLPGGRRAALEDGRDYLLGREGDLPEMRLALADCGYVSRRHCGMRLDLASCSVTIWDEGSTNGTFVVQGCNRRRVHGRESFSLPATVWLGSHVSLDIRMEG